MTPAERVAALEKAYMNAMRGDAMQADLEQYERALFAYAPWLILVAKAAVAWREATLAGMLVREAENALLAAIEGSSRDARRTGRGGWPMNVPAGIKVVPCRGCGQKIFFARTPLGKLIPLDASSLVYEIHGTAPDGTPLVRVHVGAWISHFRTCTKANQFSRSTPPSTTEGPCPPNTSAPAI